MKNCIKDECFIPQFGGGYCKFHQHMRTDKSPSLLKRTYPKKFSKKRSLVARQDQLLYDSIWTARMHYCEECNTSLGDEPHSSYFSHILSKGAHPAMRHDNRNINLLCPEHHRQWETGSRGDMNIFDKNLETIDSLKAEYYAKDHSEL